MAQGVVFFLGFFHAMVGIEQRVRKIPEKDSCSVKNDGCHGLVSASGKDRYVVPDHGKNLNRNCFTLGE